MACESVHASADTCTNSVTKVQQKKDIRKRGGIFLGERWFLVERGDGRDGPIVLDETDEAFSSRRSRCRPHRPTQWTKGGKESDGEGSHSRITRQSRDNHATITRESFPIARTAERGGVG